MKIDGLNAGGDPDVTNCDNVYGDCAFDALMASSHGFLSELLGVKLYPTYSYARLYYTGNELKTHLDRPSCEFSVTLTLGGEFKKIWPIYIEKADGEGIACHFDICDSLVVQGCASKQW